MARGGTKGCDSHPGRGLCSYVHTKPTNQVLALRRQLADEIVRVLGPGAQQGMSASYGISQPRMSELERGDVHRCTLEWLVRRIHRVGGSVRLTVTLGDVRREWGRQRFSSARSPAAARRRDGGALPSDSNA